MIIKMKTFRIRTHVAVSSYGGHEGGVGSDGGGGVLRNR